MPRADDSTVRALTKAALEARDRAYAPYSNHPVGAAVLAPNGDIFSAGNVENAAYPLGNCAEPGAIAAMVRAGQRKIDTILIAGPGDVACTPCGGCRQRIAEFADDQTEIIVVDKDGAVLNCFTFDNLLPEAFGKNNVDEMR